MFDEKQPKNLKVSLKKGIFLKKIKES